MAISELPRPSGAYSLFRRANGFVFTAGVGGHDPVTGELVGGTVAEQTVQAMRNVEAILRDAGCTLRDAVKVTVHLHDIDRDFTEFDVAYRSCLSEPFPVRTTVGSRLGGILVEIDVVAVPPRASDAG